jgi:hypothetical protein
MRKIKLLALVAAAGFMLSSCAFTKAPLNGFIYTGMKSPVTATSNSVSTKVGTAQASSILGWVATGDASIQAAAKSAGITKISHVDAESMSILGLYATYKIYVYGE